MDKKKIILLGALGVVAVGGFMQLQKMSAPAPEVVANPVVNTQPISAVEYVGVLVALSDIPHGTRINEEQLEWVKWPEEALHENLIDEQNQPTAKEDLLGAVAKTIILAGEPISNRKVIHSGDRSQMAAILKPGMRAVSVEINTNSAAGGFILPGDRVDIVLSTEVRDTLLGANQNGNQANYIATTIFEEVNVLAVDQIYGQAPDGTASIIGGTAVLELSQLDAEAITEAQERGQISLTLRGINSRESRFVPSSATKEREKATTVSSITIVRNGQPQQVAIQGQ